MAPGLATMKTIDPPLASLAGRKLTDVQRRGKMLVIEFGDRALLVHPMATGRVQLFERRASLRDKRSRLLVRIEDGRELRLREFGTQQRAWAKLLPAGDIDDDEQVASLGPDAWPGPSPELFATLIDQPRHLHPLLRDQRTIAGIGRSWVDEILWTAKLSPFRQGSELDADQAENLRRTCASVLGAAIDHYEEAIGETPPDRLPMPLLVHKRQGEPCPRCGARLEAVFFKEHTTTYCPHEQTAGRVLKDRRLSRLLR
jgi:formamidopyrimidine-DNA glycosylase